MVDFTTPDLNFERKMVLWGMANPEYTKLDLDRHIAVRTRRLLRHEKQRLLGDAAKDGNLAEVQSLEAYRGAQPADLPGIAREVYENTVTQTGKWSNATIERKTREILQGWQDMGIITQKEAGYFLAQADLGYAGETRVGVVAATSRASEKVAENYIDSTTWLKLATLRATRHQVWSRTTANTYRTIDGQPIAWHIATANDHANILLRQKKTDEAEQILRDSIYKGNEILSNQARLPHDVITAIASEIGVSSVRLAQLLTTMNYSALARTRCVEEIRQLYKTGRRQVHWAGRQTGNYERSRVVEMWYCQYLWETNQLHRLPETIPVWLWLIKNHSGTRTFILDVLKRI